MNAQQAKTVSDFAGLNGRVDNLATQVATEARAAADHRKTTDDSHSDKVAHLAALPEIHRAINALQASVMSGPRATPVGPTDKAGVEAYLATEDRVSAAVKTFGAPWLCSVSSLWPRSVMSNAEGLSHLVAQKDGMPGSSDRHAAPTTSSASLPAAAVSGALPGAPLPSSSAVSLPFAAAMGGKRFKADLPKPKHFSKLGVDSDVHLWLVRLQEYVTGFEVSIWAVIASQFLQKGPLQLWEARKAKLVAENSPELYSWESFRTRCIATFAVHDRESHALNLMMSLRQTGTVAEYKGFKSCS